MTKAGVLESSSQIAQLLSAEYLVGVGANRAIQLPRLHGILMLPAFSSANELPPVLPPGCVSWLKYTGHLLLTQVPYEARLYLHPAGTVVSVAEILAPMVALLEAAQTPSDKRLLDAFSEAVVYCAAPHTPGFLAGPDGGIAVFSSLIALRHGLGDTAWFATTGADLLHLLPDGHQFVLDPGAPHEVTVP